jgi:hypothetical protein
MVLNGCTALNSYVFPVCGRKGVVWLLLATVAEVTPVVSPSVSYASSRGSSSTIVGVP